jgi:GNAT superfamily N-acetyltransferase
MAEWEVRRLDRRHDRANFDCGQPALNEWLQLRAGQFDRKDLARTFAATRPGSTAVLGYYALATHRVLFETLPAEEAKGLPRLDVPVLLLGRLAVDGTVQGQGLGAFLLVDALRRAVHISEQAGIRAVEVDTLEETAKRFYLRFGFRPLLDDPHHLFLPMHEIRKLDLGPLA